VSNRVVRQIKRIGRRRGEPNRYILAALATGKVETGFRNLHYGDADSQGWRQERRSIYRNPTNLHASINRFYNEAHQHDHGQSIGELAADVQRPAAQYRGRYAQALPSVRGLLHGGGGGSAAAAFSGGSFRPASVRIGNKSVFDRAGYEQAKRRALLAGFLQKSGHGNSVLFRSGLLSTAPPDPADFQSSRITSKLFGGTTPKLTAARQIHAVDLRRIHGKVSISPTADRPGVHIKGQVVKFVGQVAGLYGRRLTIGTGTNHSRMTVNGNVSDHWDGYAADIPLTGGALIKAGQDALIAAGMSPRKARRQHGGLYNVGGWQVIFNTHIGGDHTNHLHVGKRH
jgi:hypothetical protein